MTTTGKVVTGAIIVAIIAVGGAVALGRKSSNSPATSTQTTTTTPSTSAQSESTKPVAATISYTDSGFSPAKTTVKAGDTVKLVNQSNRSVQFSSDPHPTHTDNPELNLTAIDAGQSTTFTVTKVGSWGFHNHLNPSERGTLIVQ